MSVLIVLVAGCTAPAPPDPAPPAPETPEPDDTDDPDTDTAPTGETGTPGTVPFDCALVPPGPRPVVPLHDLQPSEDFAFDGEGHLISATDRALVKQEYPPGAAEPFATTDSDPSSLRMLPTGDLVYANIDSQTLFRVAMDGATVPVVSGFGYATGIDIHRNGKVFIGDGSTVKRINPYTGEGDVFLNGQIPGFINGLTFSEDFSALYLGSYNTIHRVPVDADGTPTGPPAVVVELPPSGELLGMGVDLCGNLYALQGGRLLRFAGGAGAPEVLMDGGLNTTNLQWGSGIGGWDALRVYVVDRNTSRPPFYEVDVGVPSKFYW